MLMQCCRRGLKSGRHLRELNMLMVFWLFVYMMILEWCGIESFRLLQVLAMAKASK